jgi:hypothetical protein
MRKRKMTRMCWRPRPPALSKGPRVNRHPSWFRSAGPAGRPRVGLADRRDTRSRIRDNYDIDYVPRSCYMTNIPLIEGRFLEAFPEGGAGGGVLGRLIKAVAGRFGTLGRPEAMPAARVARANEAGGNSGAERGAGPKPSRWSAARRRPGCAGRPTLRKRGVALLRARQDKGYRLPALRHPLGRGSEAETRKEKRNPDAATRAGTKKTALFDMVNRKRRGQRIGNVVLDAIASTATRSCPGRARASARP